MTALREAGVIDTAKIKAFEEKLSALEATYAEISRLLSEQEQVQDEVKQFEALRFPLIPKQKQKILKTRLFHRPTEAS